MDKSSGDYIKLLEKLIETPSFSKEEDKTAKIISDFFHSKSIDTVQIKNNIIAKNKAFCGPLSYVVQHQPQVRNSLER